MYNPPPFTYLSFCRFYSYPTSRIVKFFPAFFPYNETMKTNKDPNNHIGTKIKELRIAKKETQKDLGEIIGYGATTIANYESGLRQPDVETLKRIADHFGVSITSLL